MTELKWIWPDILTGELSKIISSPDVVLPLFACLLLWKDSFYTQYNYCPYKSVSNMTPRLLPKKIFREPFGLPKLEIGSPRYISRSPRLFSIQTMSYETYSLDRRGVVPPRGGLEYKKGGDARREFWNWPLRETNLGVARATNLGVAPAFFDPLKVNKTSLKTKLLHFFACNSKRDLEG